MGSIRPPAPPISPLNDRLAPVRRDEVFWLNRRQAPSLRRRAAAAGGGMGLRLAGLVAIALGAAALMAPSGSPVEPARATERAAPAPPPKDPTRPGEAARPRAAAPSVRSQITGTDAPWSVIDPRPAGAEAPLVTGSLDLRASLGTAGTFAAEPAWREGEFKDLTVLDGRSFTAGGLRIRLSGLVLPEEGALCRTVDGRQEPCGTRAATQLELITRWRAVSCRYRMEAPGEAVGECRLGTSDLADRLVRAGYVKRSDEGAPVREASAQSL